MKRKVLIAVVGAMSILLAACGSDKLKETSSNNNSGIIENQKEETTKQKETVEITLENYQDYFEIADYSTLSHNAFGEVGNRCSGGKYLKLKDEYKDLIDPYQSTIAIEVSTTYAMREISVDLNNESFKLGSFTGESTGNGKIENTYTDINEGGYLSPLDDNDDIVFFGVYIGKLFATGTADVHDTPVEALKDFEITRVQGTLVYK